MEKILWAVKKGDEDWMETLIVSTDDNIKFENAKKWAEENGFNRFRTSIFNNEKPNFTKCVK